MARTNRHCQARAGRARSLPCGACCAAWRAIASGPCAHAALVDLRAWVGIVLGRGMVGGCGTGSETGAGRARSARRSSGCRPGPRACDVCHRCGARRLPRRVVVGAMLQFVDHAYCHRSSRGAWVVGSCFSWWLVGLGVMVRREGGCTLWFFTGFWFWTRERCVRVCAFSQRTLCTLGLSGRGLEFILVYSFFSPGSPAYRVHTSLLYVPSTQSTPSPFPCTPPPPRALHQHLVGAAPPPLARACGAPCAAIAHPAFCTPAAAAPPQASLTPRLANPHTASPLAPLRGASAHHPPSAPPRGHPRHPPSRRPPSRRASAALELVGAHLDGAAAEGRLVEELDGLGQG